MMSSASSLLPPRNLLSSPKQSHLGGEYSLKSQFAWRIAFATLFLGGLLSTIFEIKREDIITEDECIRDITFQWTDKVNKYLAAHPDLTNRYIIFCSSFMDFMIITMLVSFTLVFKSFRLPVTYLLFYGCRGVIQNNFFMTRLDGFLFRYPGFPSLTVPYHDSNDFFYSGHVGACFVVALEARAKKWYRFSWLCVFIMCNQWCMMMFIRTHYVIDMVTGLIVAHYMHILGERLSFLFDVKWMRQHLSSDKKRESFHYKPCKSCGWSNKSAAQYIPEEEKNQLKAMYREQSGLSLQSTQASINSGTSYSHHYSVDETTFQQIDLSGRSQSESKRQASKMYSTSVNKY